MTFAMSGFLSGCSGTDDDPEPEDAASSQAVPPDPVDPALKSQVEGLCRELRTELAALGDDAELDPTAVDPFVAAFIRPGAEIYARSGRRFRELASTLVPTDPVATFVSYFEVIDTVLTARVLAGGPDAPVDEDTRALEAHFQTVVSEQSALATALDLPDCAFDAFETIFGQ